MIGLEVLQASGYAALRGRRVGLMTNPSAVDRHLNSAYDLLRQGVALVALFAPEHGFAGAVRDGEPIATQTDPRTGLPVYSLYGDSLRPTAAMLAGLDVLVCDIQDIGVRFYTFAWTISHIIEAAGEHGVPVVILDRPNPLGGVALAGPGLDANVSSFVGRYPVPVQHGLTLGELAQLLNIRHNPTPADLTVIACTNWQRDMTWEQTGRPWVPPSPNMPQLSTLRHYPGACLVEGTNLSEGRGTALPFEIAGAPFIDGHQLAALLNAQGWPGVRFRPHSFRPAISKWAGEDCHGVQVHVLDAAAFRPVETWLAVIAAARTLYPAFEWLPAHFDRLIGSDTVRSRIDSGADLEPLTRAWAAYHADFRQQRQPFLLY